VDREPNQEPTIDLLQCSFSQYRAILSGPKLQAPSLWDAKCETEPCLVAAVHAVELNSKDLEGV